MYNYGKIHISHRKTIPLVGEATLWWQHRLKDDSLYTNTAITIIEYFIPELAICYDKKKY